MAILSSEGSVEAFRYEEADHYDANKNLQQKVGNMHKTNYHGTKFASGYDLKDPALMKDNGGQSGRRPATGGNYGSKSTAIRKRRDLRAQNDTETNNVSNY